MYHYHNTKHVYILQGTANINAHFQDTGIPGCFTANRTVENSNFAGATFLI